MDILETVLRDANVLNALSVEIKYKQVLNEVWMYFGVLTNSGFVLMMCTITAFHVYRKKTLKR